MGVLTRRFKVGFKADTAGFPLGSFTDFSVNWTRGMGVLVDVRANALNEERREVKCSRRRRAGGFFLTRSGGR